MRRVALILLFACATGVAQQKPRVMLAVFAHPDDETLVGPVLARYAREGAKVYLAIATKGEKGTNDRAGIPAGEALAKVRSEEAACACRQLGIRPPILFGLNDGELGAISNPLGHNIQEVADHVEKLIAELHPAVVVTWGADGGYGHPDHRLVADGVTQAIQASKADVKLFYVGFSPEQVKPLNESWAASLPWHATDPAYLTVRVAFTKADQLAYHRALECHKSQFSSEEAQKFENALDDGWQQGVLFRPWFGDRKSDDLFK
ncbi:MAG: PIG-L family deacetylase [Acidobacteriia bacterium]|nr:PIG-L family deacetylase [Terriglobia bacterium]